MSDLQVLLGKAPSLARKRLGGGDDAAATPVLGARVAAVA